MLPIALTPFTISTFAMWLGKSQQGKFSSKGLSQTTHMGWAEAGKWPLNNWESLQATAQALGQELCWRMIHIFPKHLCKPPQGLASSQDQSTAGGASLEQSKDVRFVLFATGVLKPEGFSTPPCVNKRSKALVPLASLLPSTALWRTFQIHQCYFFLYWR